MTKTGTADLMKCASKIRFRTHRVRYTSRRQVMDHSRPKGYLSNSVLDHSRPKGCLSSSVYNVPRKISFVYLRDQAILFGHGAGANVNCKLSYEKKKKKKKKMSHGKNTMKKVFAPWLTARKKVLTP